MPWRSVELNYLLFPKPQKDKVMQNVIKNPQIQIFSFGFLSWETRNTNFIDEKRCISSYDLIKHF